ncbi:hypothetical protein L6R52_25550 [Myxococcota bacterium]|nr:hypothetical protein [Myxococcota bacterium]
MGTIYEMKKPKAINSFSVSLFLIVAALGYLGYFYIPVWWPVFQLSGIMRGICNDAYRTHDDQALVDKLLKESKRTGLRLTAENFVFTRVPYGPEELSGLEDHARALKERRGKRCELQLIYTAQAKWPFLEGKVTELDMGRKVESDLAQVQY